MVDLLCATPSSCWVLCPSGGQGTVGKIIIFLWNGFLLLFYRVIDFFRNFALRIKIIKEIIMLTLKLIIEVFLLQSFDYTFGLFTDEL